MPRRSIGLVLTGFITLALLFIAGCRRLSPELTVTPSFSPITSGTALLFTPRATQAQPTLLPTQLVPQSSLQPTQLGESSPTLSPYPNPQETSGTVPGGSTASPSPSPQASVTGTPTEEAVATHAQATMTATLQPTNTVEPQYPGPGENPTLPVMEQPTTNAYPGPQQTNPLVSMTATSSSSSKTSTPQRSSTPARSATITGQASGTIIPTAAVFGASGTPAPTPTEIPPRRPLSPPPPGSHVSIWHAWNPAETEVLQTIIQSFRRLYPDVTFSLQNVPLNDLFNDYQEAAYLGQGPSLLLGPAVWGPDLSDGQLIADLTSYVPAHYLADINPAALDSGRFEGALISLPLAQRGEVMFRNTSVIGSPRTFDELVQMSHAATRAGTVGSYLERGAYFSSADLLGLGGRLMDDAASPLFDDPAGLEWLELLRLYREAGAVTFNTNRDLDMFKRGRVGLIIDGTWNMQVLIDALGADKLAILPWPTYGSGHLSGWVEADSVFLNANVSGNDRFAALAFMGYLLDPQVQLRLAEVGHVPSVMTTIPRDPLIREAMQAFSSGVAYPISEDASILNIYWNELNSAISDVFNLGIDPAVALKAASDEISRILINSTLTP